MAVNKGVVASYAVNIHDRSELDRLIKECPCNYQIITWRGIEASIVGHNAMTFNKFMNKHHGASIDTTHHVFLLESDLYSSQTYVDMLLSRFTRLEKVYYIRNSDIKSSRPVPSSLDTL